MLELTAQARQISEYTFRTFEAFIVATVVYVLITMAVKVAMRLLEGLGVEGDAHMGVTVKHRSRVAANPSAPNLRQVHLIHAELFDELRGKGFDTFAPLGPVIAVGLDPAELRVESYLNGERRQSAPVSDLIFSVPELVSFGIKDVLGHER